MKNIETEILIDAPIEVVWRTLMNFENYRHWNPFLTIEGEAILGNKLDVIISMEGKRNFFKPKVVAFEEGRRFEWTGKLILKGLFAGNHYFKLEPVTEFQTKFIHGENFTGLLKGAIMKKIQDKTIKGFESMNEAMKKYAEEQVI
ncbi:MAG: SRPBCC domain-containing protein [Reichenbachiella sp.]|uniref:SRPBCC domain-containing protein n=1 Tax=Reichenbachiella sp. TaxID=2184521 RepID=UPI003263DB66